MLGATGRTVGRILIILIVAGAISGAVYAASKSPLATSQFRGGPPGDFQGATSGRPRAVPPTGTNQQGGGPSGFNGERNRNSPSLTRGLPDLFTNIFVIGLVIAGVSYIQNRLKRRKRNATVQAIG